MNTWFSHNVLHSLLRLISELGFNGFKLSKFELLAHIAGAKG